MDVVGKPKSRNLSEQINLVWVANELYEPSSMLRNLLHWSTTFLKAKKFLCRRDYVLFVLKSSISLLLLPECAQRGRDICLRLFSAPWSHPN
ncbi:hypothetical protein OUZ56_024728 [Daphnia magna]|uniref:Uncharacterized protein n=1 Tax=Daphnia magna TaxID=35525 RepID=A0ABQ9ZJ86_9CRUS|nr:hypothetical protein OUZ56_024728 [Daphnia magna]